MVALALDQQPWIALAIGNSRLHWFYFQGGQLQKTWDTPHLNSQDSSLATDWQAWSVTLADHQAQGINPPFPELWVASVVPDQTQIWKTYPQVKILTFRDIPMHRPYASFGLDRALAVWAAGSLYGWPVLVVDGGTALTLTGAISAQDCLGGVILPGLGLQLRSLTTATANLPQVPLPEHLPQRWATDTSTAIQAGVIYTLTAGLAANIGAWLQDYPHSQIVFTGGDGQHLGQYLQQWHTQHQQTIDWVASIHHAPALLAQGIQHLRQQQAFIRG